jgi:hypothetical protein
MGKLLPACAILCLWATNEALSLEAGSNIGKTPIDRIIFKDGINADNWPPGERSPLPREIRAHLVKLAKQGGAAAMEAALSEADASCNPPVRHTYRCEIRRYRVIRSLDLIFAKYGRTDWIVSVTYDRRGNEVQNVHVTFTEASKILE